jgi:hypothetical protein
VESFPITYQFLVVTEMGKVSIKLLSVPPLVVGLLPEGVNKAVNLVS